MKILGSTSGHCHEGDYPHLGYDNDKNYNAAVDQQVLSSSQNAHLSIQTGILKKKIKTRKLCDTTIIITLNIETTM